MINLLTRVTKNGAIVIRTETADHLVKVNGTYENGIFTYGVYIVINSDSDAKVIDEPVIVREMTAPLEQCLEMIARHLANSSTTTVGSRRIVTWNGVKGAIEHRANIDLNNPGKRLSIYVEYRDIDTLMSYETFAEGDMCVLYRTHLDGVSGNKISCEDLKTTTRFYRKGLV